MADGNGGVSRAVLVTGCSSGIGEATARHLAGAGWTVYATARREETLAPLRAAGCRTLALDVTDEDSMRDAVAAVTEAEGAVGVLVNNAGYSQSGMIEEVPMDLVRRQFETNVFGLARMCQLVLGGMRAQRYGRIVNVSSIGGRLVFPGGGYYHATKHAVEAISDALRFEVGGFGVQVIVVEPGLIRTGFSDAAVGAMTESGAPTESGPYATLNRRVARATREAYEKGPVSWLGGGPDTVARTIERAISAERPRSRYAVTASAHLMLGMRRVATDGLWDAFMRTQFPQPR
jgi:NAD(P)-dependent dehydrogenase (short-subunit alcohol dehydrogenase family)